MDLSSHFLYETSLMIRRMTLLMVVCLTLTQFAPKAYAVIEGGGPWVGEPFGLDACAIVEEKISFNFQDSPARVAIDYELIVPAAADLPLRIITADGVSLFAQVDGRSIGIDSAGMSIEELHKLNADHPREPVNFPNEDAYTEHTLRLPTGEGSRRLHIEYDVKPSFSMDSNFIEYRYHNREVPRQRLLIRILVDPEQAEATLGGCDIQEKDDQWMTIDKVLDESIFATANSISLWRLKSAAAFANESISGRRTAFLAVGLGLVALGVVAGLKRREMRRGPAFRRAQLGLTIVATTAIGYGCGVFASDDGGNSVLHQRQMAMLANETFASRIADRYWERDREEDERGMPLGIPISDLPGVEAAMDNAVSLGVGWVREVDEGLLVILRISPSTQRDFLIKGGRIEPTFAGCGDMWRDVIRDLNRFSGVPNTDS